MSSITECGVQKKNTEDGQCLNYIMFINIAERKKYIMKLNWIEILRELNLNFNIAG